MAKTSPSKRLLLEKHLAEANPPVITEAECEEIRKRLAPVSESYLRQLLRACGRPLAPLVEGVRQDSFANLESSLMALARIYADAAAQGDTVTANRCRRLVIEAKDHARLAARSPKSAPEKRAEKSEMIEWMVIWLENPGIFPTWAKLRTGGLQG